MGRVGVAGTGRPPQCQRKADDGDESPLGGLPLLPHLALLEDGGRQTSGGGAGVGWKGKEDGWGRRRMEGEEEEDRRGSRKTRRKEERRQKERKVEAIGGWKNEEE